MTELFFEEGKLYRYAGDNNRIYRLDAIYGDRKNAPSQGVLYIITEYGRVPKTVRRAQYVLTEEMAARDLSTGPQE